MTEQCMAILNLHLHFLLFMNTAVKCMTHEEVLLGGSGCKEAGFYVRDLYTSLYCLGRDRDIPLLSKESFPF